jgi:uncharacterized protein YndB with AHSA1/START domain
MRQLLTGFAVGLAVLATSPAAADVAVSSESGFVSHNEAVVAATAAEVWAALLKPAGWWNGEHTYSGNAANLTLDPVAGGCFCEVIPNPPGGPAGQVEHMRVIYLAPNSTLRLTGGLGPLQSEAVTAVLTMAIEPLGDGTKITWDYVVGGYMRASMTEFAPVVDRVIGEQLSRLAASLAKRQATTDATGF